MSFLCKYVLLALVVDGIIGVRGGPSYSYPFHAPATLGSHGSPQIFSFDTGSSHFWVASTRCNESDCLSHTRYNHSASNTYQDQEGQLAEIDYGDLGMVKGRLARDQLRFNGVRVWDQKFVEALNLPDREVLPRDVDGIIGMDLSTFHTNATYKNPLKLMVEQGSVQDKMFSVSADRRWGPYRGKIVFGQPPRHLYQSSIVRFPVTHPNRWQFRLSGIATKGEQTVLDFFGPPTRVRVCQNGCDVVVSTGMPVILGPKDEVRKLNNDLGATRMDDGTYVLYGCDLNRLPHLVLESRSYLDLVILPKQYVIPVTSTRCLSGIFEGSESFWVLGQSALRSFHIEFDYGKRVIGFAKGS